MEFIDLVGSIHRVIAVSAWGPAGYPHYHAEENDNKQLTKSPQFSLPRAAWDSCREQQLEPLPEPVFGSTDRYR